VTGLTVADLELDEQWSFAGCKKAPSADNSERGVAWRHKSMAREGRLLVKGEVPAMRQGLTDYVWSVGRWQRCRATAAPPRDQSQT